MPFDSSRHLPNGTRNVCCSGVKLTGDVEIVPSAAQKLTSVQFVAAGHWIGGEIA